MEDEYTSYGQLLDLVSRIEECGYAEAEEKLSRSFFAIADDEMIQRVKESWEQWELVKVAREKERSEA